MRYFLLTVDDKDFWWMCQKQLQKFDFFLVMKKYSLHLKRISFQRLVHRFWKSFHFNYSEKYQVFVDLFNVATYLIPQKFLPPFRFDSNPASRLVPFQSPSTLVLAPHREVPIVIPRSMSSQSQINRPTETPPLLIYGIILLIPVWVVWIFTKLIRSLFPF